FVQGGRQGWQESRQEGGQEGRQEKEKQEGEQAESRRQEVQARARGQAAGCQITLKQGPGMSEVLLLLTNLPDEASAGVLATHLVEHRLAACVNQLAPVRSVYRWQGQVEQALEIPLLIKTTREAYAAV